MTMPFEPPAGPPVAGQDYVLADEYSSRRPPDPDPLMPSSDWMDGYQAGWEDAPLDRAPRPLAGYVVVGLVGLALGFLLATHVVAAPRPAQTTERVDVSAPSSAGPIGAPSVRGGLDPVTAQDEPSSEDPSVAPAMTGGAPSIELPPASEGGIASFMAPSYGSRYLALPAGPGHHVRICPTGLPDHPERCVERTSTDAGPDLSMQADGRIADLSFDDFATVCGCDPWVVGLVDVTIEDLDE